MDMQQNPEGMTAKNTKKKALIVIAAALAALAALWWWQSTRAPIEIGQENSAMINEDIENLDIGNIDTEFEMLDTELNQL